MTTEKTAIIECLPKGAFSITTIDGKKITGAFTLEVIDRFCESKKIPSYFDAINKILSGMTIGEYAELLCMAVSSETFDKKGMLTFINDEFDGISADFLKLIVHAAGRLGKVTGNADAVTDDDGKKKEQTDLTDTNLESNALPQGLALPGTGNAA